MAKEELLEMQGVVEDVLPDGRFRVLLENGHQMVAYTAGKMKKNHIRILLGDIPADEVVPMYFRLGRSRPDYEARSAAGVPEPRCALAHGLADDEAPWPQALPGRRYLFLGHRTRRPPHPPTH
mgnify:CR=1 FL=1